MIKNISDGQHWKLYVLMLKIVMEKKGIQQIEVCERTGMAKSNLSRFFALKHPPGLNTFILIARALDVNFFIIHDQNERIDLNQIFEQAMAELERREKRDRSRQN